MLARVRPKDATWIVATALDLIDDKAEQTEFESPFQNTTERIIIRLTKNNDDDSSIWCPPRWSRPDTKHLDVVESWVEVSIAGLCWR